MCVCCFFPSTGRRLPFVAYTVPMVVVSEMDVWLADLSNYASGSRWPLVCVASTMTEGQRFGKTAIRKFNIILLVS